MKDKPDFLFWEKQFWPRYPLIAGLDEAGRGAWAGPVVAAAAVFEKDCLIPGVDDSKKLTPKKREQLFDVIIERAVCYQIAAVDSVIIDEINIHEATKRAWVNAVAGLPQKPDYLLIDGNAGIASDIPFTTVVDGDALCHCIAAASILAKVTRDRLMVEYAKQFPQYGFEKHKGYGTKDHQVALAQHGCLSIHRRSYAPIRALIGV